MKRLFVFLLSLSLCAALSAQEGKVVTPRTVNPETVLIDSLQTGVRVTGQPASGRNSGRWLFGLGGGLDYNSATGWYVDICPDIAYRCNDALFLGGRVSYTYYDHTSRMGLIPYSRIHFVPLGKMVTLFATLEAPCYFWSDYLSLGAWARPGIGVRVSEGAYVMASYGAFGYTYARQGGVPASGWLSRLDSDTLSLGIYFNL